VNVYAARNGRTEGIIEVGEFGGHHSALIVVVAETLQEAKVSAHEYLTEMKIGWGWNLESDEVDRWVESLSEIPIEHGVVLVADGEC